MARHTSTSPSLVRFVNVCLIVFLILFIVPLFVYSAFSFVTGMEPPAESSPRRFMASVILEKIGHSVAFVLIFTLAGPAFGLRWRQYAFAWWMMFATSEVALAIRQPTYTPDMALAGVFAEAIYLPLAAWAVQRLLAAPRNQSARGSGD